MKILFFINGLHIGGKERRLVELLKGLKSNPDVQFELILMEKDVHYKEALDLGIKIHYFIRRTKKDLRVFKMLYDYCNEYKPDIIHCWDSMTSIYSAPVCKLLNIQLLNGMVVDTPVKKNIFNKYWLRARLSFPSSNFIIGNSNAGLEAYKAPKKKSVCIYNGFNFQRIKQTSYDRRQLKENYNINSRHVVIMVGEFSARKDYDTYVDAAKIICDKRNDVAFIALGDGVNFKGVSEKIEPRHKNNIRLLGRQSNVEAFINVSDIGVLTTNAKVHGEGISNSILEYMAMGKPVIATMGGGTNEIVDDQKTGFLIAPASPVSLSEKIEFLLNNESIKRDMGEAGKSRIVDQFSIKKMVDSYIRIYRIAKDRKDRKRRANFQRFILRYYNKLFVTQWTLGFCKGNISDMIKDGLFDPDIRWLKNSSVDQFYADPFIIKSQDEEFKVFVEDFNFNRSHGRISVLTFDKSLNLVHKKVLLNSPRHFSYPFVFRDNDKFYIFPESSATGNLSCYEYDTRDDSIKFFKKLIDLPILDPTILKHQNKYWIFGTLTGVDSDKRLHIYISDSLLGPYTPHPKNPVKISDKRSRSAGNFIEIDGYLYRPSQNNVYQYGESIVINKIIELNEYNFHEESFFSITVNKKNKLNKGIKGIHTINIVDNVIIVDGAIQKFAPFKKIKYYFKKKNYLKALRIGKVT